MRSRLTLPEIRSLSPDTVSGPIATHCPPPYRGWEEAAVAAGRWGCFGEGRSTRDAGDMGGGSRLRLPPPRQPLPAWRFPIDTVPGDRSSLCRQREHPAKDPFHAPSALYPAYRHILPAPLRGREEALKAPGGGGDPAKNVQSETQETGGAVSALPVTAPSPSTEFTVHRHRELSSPEPARSPGRERLQRADPLPRPLS